MITKNKHLLLLLICLLLTPVVLISCSSDSDDNIEVNDANDAIDNDNDDSTGDGDDDDATGDDSADDDSDNDDQDDNADDDMTPPSVDRNSLATNGCDNVTIVGRFAYAACRNEIEIIDLDSSNRNLLNISGSDITADENLQLLFALDRNVINVFSISDPMNPNLLMSLNTNFSIFSGISAANGVLVVSAGAGGSNTQIFTYTSTSVTLATNGNATIDNVTGNPDVHVIGTSSGATAFYSQDIGAVANWAIQIANIDTNGMVVSTPPSITLTARQFTGSFAPFIPSNFPVESEFLNNRLYVAHFAVPGVEVIDLTNNTLMNPINLSYDPSNIGTDGTSLFVVGPTNNTVDIIDPSTTTISSSVNAMLQEPRGVDANSTHIVVADGSEGMIVITRE